MYVVWPQFTPSHRWLCTAASSRQLQTNLRLAKSHCCHEDQTHHSRYFYSGWTDMATLDSLKWGLRKKATAMGSSPRQPLSDIQNDAGFDILLRGPGWMTYQDFIIPQLLDLLAPLFNSRICISVLEIGPRPKSVLGYLPGHLRKKIRRYAAFEPNDLFATRVEKWLCPTSET